MCECSGTTVRLTRQQEVGDQLNYGDGVCDGLRVKPHVHIQVAVIWRETIRCCHQLHVGELRL